MHIKSKWWLVCLSLLVSVSVLTTVGYAADTMTDVSGQKTSNGPDYWGGEGTYAPAPVSSSDYPTITKVTANNTVKLSTGQSVISNKTTKINVTYSGRTFKFTPSLVINKLYLDIAYGNRSGNSQAITVVSGAAQANLANGGTSVNVPSTTISYTVDLSTLKGKFPLLFAMQMSVVGTYSGDDVTGDVTYALGRLGAPELKPTIKQTGSESGTVKSSDSTITGTGTPGSTITNSFNDTTTTVGSDGNYSLDLGKKLGSTKNITITETNDDIGATAGTATATVEASPLTLSVTNKTLTITDDDITGFKDDAAVLAWIIKQSGATASNPDDTDDVVSVVTDNANLLSTLKGLGDNASMTVNIYGENSAGSKTSTQTITITKSGSLKFGTVSNLDFGTMKVPSSEEFVQGKNLTVEVQDTRATGSSWQLGATMSSPMTSTTNSAHTLQLYYRDGDSKQLLSTAQTEIATGTKAAGVTTTNVGTANNWSTTKGIFLDVPPTVSTESYQGTIQWTLTDGPTN